MPPALPRLSELTTMEVGGRPVRFDVVEREAQVVEALEAADRDELPVHVLGGGSNVVVADDGIAGAVLHVQLRGIDRRVDGDDVLVTAAAGENWDAFCATVTEENLAGLECLGGIPGNVGAAPIQNVGAYGQEVSDTLESVSVLDRRTNEKLSLTARECAFGYRDSVFKSSAKNRYLVLDVTFRLRRAGAPKIRYGELEKRLSGRAHPSLAEVRSTVIELRRNKSMVLEPEDENRRSCGSFFVNCLVGPQDVERITHAAGTPPPRFPRADGRIKVPAAWLIERAGLARGLRMGPVGLSTKHTLCLVAHEGATANDVLRLAHHVRKTVLDAFGIELRPEPHFWGFSTERNGLPDPTG